MSSQTPSPQESPTLAFAYHVTIYDTKDSLATVQQKAVDLLATLIGAREIHYSKHPVCTTSTLQHTTCYDFCFAIVLANHVQKSHLIRLNPSNGTACVKSAKIPVGKFDVVASKSDTVITIVQGKVAPPGLHNTNDTTCDIIINGKAGNVKDASLRVLVLLDEMSGLNSDTFEIDIRLFTIIAGRKRCNLHSIMHDTATNIYVPSVFRLDILAVPQLSETTWNSDPKHKSNIYITGERDNIANAKKMLLDLVELKKSGLISKPIVCLSKKLDWLYINRKEMLESIMTNNATLLILPPLCSNTNLLTVLGDDLVFVERSIRTVMMCICDFYVACLRRLIPPSLDLNAKIHGAMDSICRDTGADIILHPQYIEICGEKAVVKKAYDMMVATEYFKSARDSKFQLELAHEHREFINGKKNGKINKIIKISGSKVNFQETFKGYNMLIEIQNTSPMKALEGLTLLEDEMPAEISFFVPESFHKRIIGVGGKNIQRIMKKYGVYVKFSNAEEFATLGGYFENCDNVIARTPAKNASNLEQLRLSIFELIASKEQGDELIHIKVIRQLHRVIAGAEYANIHEIENATGASIIFPERELGIEDIDIKGTESQIKEAKNLIREHAPEVLEIHVPASKNARLAIDSDDFDKQVYQKLRDEHSADVFVYIPKVRQSSPKLPPVEEEALFDSTLLINIVIHYFAAQTSAEKVKLIVTTYLSAHEVSLIAPEKAVSRVASFSNVMNAPRTASYDSFQHFNSKLLAPTVSGAEATSTNAIGSNYSLFDGMGRTFDLDGIQAHSAPNLRALFEEAVSFGAGGNGKPSIAAGGSKVTASSNNISNVRAPHRSHLSESYENMFPRSVGDDSFDDGDNVDNLLGATLAATNFESGCATSFGGSQRNLLDHSSSRSSLESLNFNSYGVGPEWMRQESDDTSNGGEMDRIRVPSKLRNEIAVVPASPVARDGESIKRWNNTPGTNPNAPSFLPNGGASFASRVAGS